MEELIWQLWETWIRKQQISKEATVMIGTVIGPHLAVGEADAQFWGSMK